MVVRPHDEGNPWPVARTLIRIPQDVNIRQTPNGEILRSDLSGVFTVVARSSDSSWYKIITEGEETGWVAASVVEVLSMEEDVPVETP